MIDASLMTKDAIFPINECRSGDIKISND